MQFRGNWVIEQRDVIACPLPPATQGKNRFPSRSARAEGGIRAHQGLCAVGSQKRRYTLFVHSANDHLPRRRMFCYLACLLLCLASIHVPSIHAQDEPDPIPLTPGTLITGTIDDSQPRMVYTLQGSRGEVVRIRLTTTSGTLDPVLAIFNEAGEVIYQRDDSAGSRNIDTTLTIQENGVHALVVGRFGYAVGATSGEYELSLERVGIQSSEGSNLQYGIPVTNSITNAQSQIFYTFQASQGDILNIEMSRSSGNLDPVLQVVDAERFLVAENDDFSGSTRNARIENLLIEEGGTYIVVATRYGGESGTTVGNFVLTVEEARNSGLGNSAQAPATILLNQTVQGTITDSLPQRYYQFSGTRNQIITVTMERASPPGQLDAYIILANAGFQSLIENDDGGGGQNARIARFRLPADGIYYVIATRFERDEGTTTGEYRLTLQSQGFAFQDVPSEIPRLEYGQQILAEVTDDAPSAQYVFWGTEGDQVRIAMDRSGGDLNPFLELLDADGLRIVLDDDSGASQNAQIDAFTLPYTGVYYIRASRYEGSASPSTTTGSYTLSLVRVEA